MIAVRVRVYALLAASFFVLAVVMAGIKAMVLKQPFDLVVGDGRFYYAYLPSVVIDRDLDFSNQISQHWGPDYRPAILNNRSETGLVRNKYPIGMALTLAPAFLLGHVIALGSFGLVPANGYSWPYQLFCLALIELLVLRTLLQIDRLLTGRYNVAPRAALLGILTVALATPYVYYACREPFMVHAVSTFWCTEIVAIAAAWQRGFRWLWPRIAFCGAMAVVCRPTNMHLLPVAIWAVVQLARSTSARSAALYLPFTAVALLPIGLQLLTWRILSGEWVHYSYGSHRFYWTHPALLQTLLSTRHGLFLWSPVLLVAVAGLVLKARDALVFWWLFGALTLWYANSAWDAWWFGQSFGGRAFLELTGLFGIGLGYAFFLLRDKPRWTAALVVLPILLNLALMALYITHRIPRE